MQGDPTSPNLLAQVLRPWHTLVLRACPGIAAWAHVDDRSLRCSAPWAPKDFRERLASLPAVTKHWVWLHENLGKRQRWQDTQTVEHLGLRLSPACFQPPCLRAGWEPVFDLIALLPCLPGGFAIRGAAARVFVKPMWGFPLPVGISTMGSYPSSPTSSAVQLFHLLVPRARVR